MYSKEISNFFHFGLFRNLLGLTKNKKVTYMSAEQQKELSAVFYIDLTIHSIFNPHKTFELGFSMCEKTCKISSCRIFTVKELFTELYNLVSKENKPLKCSAH